MPARLAAPARRYKIAVDEQDRAKSPVCRRRRTGHRSLPCNPLRPPGSGADLNMTNDTGDALKDISGLH
jgi:hypothetical protein